MVAHDPGATFAMVQAARRATAKPLLAKLSPDVTDLVPLAQAAERAGADALTVGNTYVGMSLDAATGRSRVGTLTGGLSGPAIRPLTVYRVWYTARSVRVPIIGVGGIMCAADAVEFFLAGAAAVAVGTATFADPRAAVRVLAGLERYLARRGLTSLEAIRGTAHTEGSAHETGEPETSHP
jgi:dihydroorotate dehydrogenase (NAD+) catalytic subunit